jgi:hypothetical protein
MVLARMSDKTHAAAIKAARARISDRLAEVDREIAECGARQEAIAAKWGARKMSDKAFDRANEPLIADLARLEAEREELTGGNPDGPTEAMSREEAAEKWDAADIGEQRAMLTDALGRDTLYVDPSDRTGFRTFNPKRVRVEPYKPDGRSLNRLREQAR